MMTEIKSAYTAVLCCSLITAAQAAGYKRIGDVTGEVCAHYIIFSICHMTDVRAGLGNLNKAISGVSA
jgi:hypothetical protein